jgi:nucleotide-binding universal stress UspA family protein
MYSKILAGLDGSKISERILPYARFFAEKLKIPIELLAVIDPETFTATETHTDAYRGTLLPERKKTAADYLKNIAGKYLGGFSVDCVVEIGKPADAIVDRAANDSGTLIAIGTHGRAGIQRWLLGSVADKVLHAARNPLLIVRTMEETKGIETSKLKSILVPLDGSVLAETVMAHALELARRMDLEIVLVRIFNLPTAYYDEGYAPDERVWEMIRDEAQEYLDRKVKELKSGGLPRVTSVLLEGFAGERIINLARETPENLIAICTHGRSGVRRFVLGSIADRVVRHSGDPVLVIRAPGAPSGT